MNEKSKTPARPAPLPVIPENIPERLKADRAWVVWRYILKGEDWTKPPFNAGTGKAASHSDPATWSSWEEALAAYGKGGWDGLGYVLHRAEGEVGGLVGIDLDDCLDPSTGEPEVWALDLVGRMRTYTERSPSGKGLRLLCLAEQLPAHGRKSAKDGHKVEVYENVRYLTLTGHRLPGTPLEIEVRAAELLAWHASVWPAGTESRGRNGKAGQQKGGCDSFWKRRTTNGRPSPYGRALAYLRKTEPAVSKQGGHSQAFRAARAVVLGFDLGPEIGYEVLQDWNASCQPPWSPRELWHKCVEADTKPFNKPRGWLLDEDRAPAHATRNGTSPATAPPHPPDEPPQGGGTGDNGTPAAWRIREDLDDPHRLARSFLLTQGGTIDLPHLRWWRAEWWRWREAAGRYAEQEDGDTRAALTAHLKEVFNADYLARVRRAIEEAVASGEDPQAAARAVPAVRKVNTRIVGNVMLALHSLASLSGTVLPPAWIGAEPRTATTGLIACRNVALDLQKLVANDAGAIIPASPELFVTTALGTDFQADAPEPSEWLKFLASLWPNDQDAIDLLQEWFGYLITPDTSQHRMLLVIGPPRSGKGTIARVLRSLMGEDCVCGPTLSSLGTPFGLQPLLNKSLATINDARLDGRADMAMITERLLSISGEDATTVDRKHLPSITTRLGVRFLILTNELPRLRDASGALMSRLLILRLLESWRGREDRELTGRLLGELPGILLWAIAGWARLRERGAFRQPESADDVISDLGDLSSPIRAFVEDRCQIGPRHCVTVADLFAAWQTWCSETGEKKPGTSQVLGRNLCAAFPQIRKSRPREGETRYRSYDGIGLLSRTNHSPF